MTLVQLREFLLSQPGATEDTPFGPEILVYRIAGKMFALVDWQAEPLSINLKCEPELALLLREMLISPSLSLPASSTPCAFSLISLTNSLDEYLRTAPQLGDTSIMIAGMGSPFPDSTKSERYTPSLLTSQLAFSVNAASAWPSASSTP